MYFKTHSKLLDYRLLKKRKARKKMPVTAKQIKRTGKNCALRESRPLVVLTCAPGVFFRYSPSR
jgi:hypothetical protein